jgi:hypothetical protein
MAKSIGAIPVPDEKSDHQSHADRGYDMAIGLGSMY